MIKSFKKIWVDPVWSKVISTFIISIFLFGYTKYLAFIEGVSFYSKFISIAQIKVELWKYLAISLLSFLIVNSYLFIRNQRQKKLLKPPYFYDDTTLNLDRAIFERIRRELLPQDGNIFSLRQINFESASISDSMMTEFEYIQYIDGSVPDMVFHNPQLEELRLSLFNEICEYVMMFGQETFTNDRDQQEVPIGWVRTQPERRESVVSKLNKKANCVVEKYDAFIKEGRRVLKV